jgi:DNA-binding NtrC family response regulator
MESVLISTPILIVDDEASVRESMRDWLMDRGYEVEVAGTGEEALEMVATKDFSLLILDYRLPGKTGLEVLREVKASKPRIKSIIITAYPSADLNSQLRKLGASDDLLIKPVMTEDLEKMVQKKVAQTKV